MQVSIRNDFFDMPAIKKIRHENDGCSYALIYMSILQMAAKNGGAIMYKHKHSNIYEQVAREICRSEKLVKYAFMTLMKHNLLKDCGNNIWMLTNYEEYVQFNEE